MIDDSAEQRVEPAAFIAYEGADDLAEDYWKGGSLYSDRKIDMVPLKDVQAVTGYIRGGVTALACKKEYPVYIDETAELWDVISISAGQRGFQIFLSPADYIAAVRATSGDIARQK